MDSDRPPHRSGTVTGDLFICFTSMKTSSRSILSPNKSNNRDPPISLTTSLSRRLRTNRSIKGGTSPAMFPSTGKKRNFENPEPSSPKVTCIGQVRVKSKKKKQGKRLRSLSRRHNSFCKNTNLGSSFGSFGRNQETLQEQSNNQRWVHLPFTICEALRAFGSEFSCLFPCRSSCFSSPAKEKVEKEEGHRSSLCTRWLVVDGGRRDIELMVRDENGEENVRVSRRQHVFDDLEIVNNRIEGCNDESESRLSICIPPKNALMLMRCRSDPLKMEALANRLWESTISANNLDDDDDDDDDDNEYEDEIIQKTVDFIEFEANQETELKQSIQEEQEKEQILEINEEKERENEKEDEITFFGSLFDEIVDKDEEIEEFDDEMLDASELFEEAETGEESNIEKVNHLPECLLLMMCEPKLSMEVSKETWVSSKDFFRRQPSRKKPPPPPLPPLPPVPLKPSDGQDESKVTIFTNATKYDKLSKDSVAAAAMAPVQPGRSSCSLPVRPSMAEILEQKLVNAVGYEPFVLTRCKSEPMRTAAAKLAPDTCYWKNRKLEPLRRASFGVGAAGIGF